MRVIIMSEKWAKRIRLEYYIATGNLLFALALLFRPHAGTIGVWFGVHAAYFMVGVFLAGAWSGWYASSLNGSPFGFAKRQAVIILAGLPIFIYGLLTLIYFVFVRGLAAQTASLTGPLAYFGIIAAMIVMYAQSAICDAVQRLF